MRRRKRISKLLWTAVISAVSVIMLLPLVWMVSASLKTPTKVFTSPIEWIPRLPQWSNYAAVWSEGAVPFRIYFMNSIFVTVLSLAWIADRMLEWRHSLFKSSLPSKNGIFMDIWQP